MNKTFCVCFLCYVRLCSGWIVCEYCVMDLFALFMAACFNHFSTSIWLSALTTCCAHFTTLPVSFSSFHPTWGYQGLFHMLVNSVSTHWYSLLYTVVGVYGSALWPLDQFAISFAPLSQLLLATPLDTSYFFVLFLKLFCTFWYVVGTFWWLSLTE